MDKVFEKGAIPETPGWWDMADYVKREADRYEVESVLDVGTGPKGVVAMHYWDRVQRIKQGYACDVWTIKELPDHWEPLKMNALDLLDRFKPDSIDVFQAFGFLEHLTREDGLRILEIAETIASKLVIVSAANCLHGWYGGLPGWDPDYKVKVDGNPYHRYNSTWHWRQFEALGYESNLQHAKEKKTFILESIAWKHLEEEDGYKSLETSES